MSVFKRANWHSGLTYHQVCPLCKTEVTYQDDKLGFRPWFPDGFVYCPTCEKPLRHNENLAIDKKDDVEVESSAVKSEKKEFCTQCGAEFKTGDKFCSQCGNKR